MSRGRAYLRVLPESFARKAFGVRDAQGKLVREPYPAAAVAAFYGLLCLAESQPERGRFSSLRVVRALLEGPNGEGRIYARQVPYLVKHRDLVAQPGGLIYVDGWDELQEGDVEVNTRMRNFRGRHGGASEEAGAAAPIPGAARTANWRLRTHIFDRDQFTCRYCGIDDYPREWLVLEHVIPDGPSTEENLVTACRGCNKRKGGQTPEEAGMTLREAPSVTSRDASPSTSRKPGDASQRGASHRNNPSTAIESTPSVLLSGERLAESGGRRTGPPSRGPDGARATEPTWFDGEAAVVGAGDQLGDVQQWLAKERSVSVPDGGGLRELARLVDQHGAPAVIEALACQDGTMKDGRQYVFGAMKTLNPLPSPPRAPAETPEMRDVRQLQERAEARRRARETGATT